MDITKRELLGGFAVGTLLAGLPVVASGAPRKVLIVASSVDIPNFDPHVASGYAPAALLRNTYDALVRVEGTPPQTVPSLAISWTASDDGLHYEFRLDPAAKFHDGSPVTA